MSEYTPIEPQDWNQEVLDAAMHNTAEAPSMKPQTPSQPKKKIKHRYTIIAVLMVFGTIYAGFKWAKELSVDTLIVTGNFYTHEEDILKKAALRAGTKTDSLDLLVMIERIETLPYVKEAYLSIGARGIVNARIIEREPIALLIENDQKCYVDEDGIKMPVNLGRIPDVPLLYGFKVHPMTDTLSGRSFALIKDFLVHASLHPFLHATISEVAYSSDEGVIALSHENGVKLIFGKEDFAEKLKVWRGFYAQVIPEKGISRFQSIDFRYNGQVVTRES